MKEQKEQPLVSIIIPTYNSEKTLPLCLKSIKNQTYKNIEIIIVDNYSKDKTIEIAKKYNAKVILVKGERTKAKNIGLHRALGKYVLFIDSDMILTSKVIEECVKTVITNTEIAGIIIPERTIGNNYLARLRDFERNFYINTQIESPRFFNKELALKVGGFDEDIVFYEEATLAHKIEKLGYITRARINAYILHYEGYLSLTKLLMKKYHYGKTMGIYLAKYGNKAKCQVSPLYRLWLFMSDRNFWKKPHMALSVILLKILEYIATMVGATMEVIRTHYSRFHQINNSAKYEHTISFNRHFEE